MANWNWKQVALTVAFGAATAGAAIYAQKKTKSLPLALAAGGATAFVLPLATVWVMDKVGLTGLSGLVMEQVAALPEMRTRSLQSDYRGLVMEQVSGCWPHAA